MTRILITGGAGFLGSHLCKRSIASGSEVICLDNLYTGAQRNISNLLDVQNFRFLQHDITEPIELEVDQVFNFACPASPVHYQKDPVSTVRTSIQSAINVLDLANKSGARVLQASTSEVYGDPEIHPQTENYWGRVNPVGIRACYDEGKRCAETLFFDYHRQYQTDIKVVRIFNTYGPNMSVDDGRVISNFIVQALRGEDLTVYGTGEQTRSVCFVDDLIDVILKMMGSDSDFQGPVNIGNDCEYSIGQIAEKVLALIGGRSKIVYSPIPQDDPRQRCPDISLAKSKLDWTPRVSLDDGLRETIRYFKGVL